MIENYHKLMHSFLEEKSIGIRNQYFTVDTSFEILFVYSYSLSIILAGQSHSQSKDALENDMGYSHKRCASS